MYVINKNCNNNVAATEDCASISLSNTRMAYLHRLIPAQWFKVTNFTSLLVTATTLPYPGTIFSCFIGVPLGKTSFSDITNAFVELELGMFTTFSTLPSSKKSYNINI